MLCQCHVDTNCTHPHIEGLPVLVVGMPKSGTTSIGEFLRCGGWCVSHNTCKCDTTVAVHRHCAFHPNYSCGVCALKNFNAGRPPLEHCGNFSAFTQLDVSRNRPYPHNTCFFPQVDALVELSEEFPNATFLLNLRPVSHWIASVTNWRSMRDALTQCNITGLPPGVGAQDIELEKFYEQHSENIRSFVKRRPRHRLIQVNIESPYAGHVLSDALDIPSQCWGHSNANLRI